MREKREDVLVTGTGKEGEGGGRGGRGGGRGGGGGGGGGGEDMYRGTCRFRRVGEMGFRDKGIHSVCGSLRRVDVDTKGLGLNWGERGTAQHGGQEPCESRGGRPGLPSLISLRFLWT